jgi:hypothetical protein
LPGREPGGNRIVSYKLTYDKKTGLPDTWSFLVVNTSKVN